MMTEESTLVKLFLAIAAVLSVPDTSLLAQREHPVIAKAITAVTDGGGTYERAVVSVSFQHSETFSYDQLLAIGAFHDTLLELTLSFTSATDDDLRNLRGFEELRDLDLMNTRVTDEVFAHLATLTNLQSLRLGRTAITGTGLRELKNLARLKQLSLRQTKINEQGLESLKLIPSLTDLELDDTETDNEGIAHLKHLVNLKKLSLTKTKLARDGGLGSLASLKHLSDIRLSFTQVDDQCIRSIASMPSLAFLFVDNTLVSPAGIHEVAVLQSGGNFAKLQYLQVDSSQLTDGAREALQKAFPDLELRVRDDP
jgi:hypothetical protein